MTVLRQLLLFLGLLGIWLGAGCRGGSSEPVAAEIDEPYYRQGQQQVKQGRTQEALASFLKVIEKRGEQSSAESHLEAGSIYLKHSKDPVEAYHHFRLYLAQQPNSRQAPLVRELLAEAKKEFARTLPGQPLENQAQRMDFLDQIEKLQRENQELRVEIAALRNGANTPILKSVRVPANGESPPRTNTPAPVPVMTIEEDSPVTPAPVPPRPIATTPPPSIANAPRANGPATNPPTSSARPAPTRPGAPLPTGTRRHVVVQSDSLFAIARKYYGTPSVAKAKAIYEANRDVMKNEGDLRPGMELKIP